MKRFRSILFLLAAALLFGGAPARAYLLAVEVLWTVDFTAEPYNLQEGSIIQIVAFASGGTGKTEWNHDVPGENFTHYSGNDKEPYDDDVYLPNTTPDGHHIVGSGTLQQLNPLEYGDDVYGMTAIIDVPDAYDSVYVRVFSATGFEQGVVSNNVHWGISDVHPITNKWGTALTWFDDVEAPHIADFELIPEPSSLAFLLSGGCGMGVFAVFRRRRKLRSPEE